MNICFENYKEPHLIILIFKKLSNPTKTQLEAHEEYYRNLKGSVETVHYGEVMNDEAVCAILRSSEAETFEKIIENDPMIQSNALHIHQIIPLSGNYMQHLKSKYLLKI